LEEQATLEEQNEESYKEIVRWVCNRQFCDAQQQLYRSAGFTAIHAIQQQESGGIFKKGPHMVGSFNKQLHTGFLFLGKSLRVCFLCQQ
jgi:predicted  nucleic acid-binding Zn ribbon protein